MKDTGLQVNLFGEPVHILNTKEIYRMVKCGECGKTVKMSQAKSHLSYGKVLTICKECLKKEGMVYERKNRRDEIVSHKESTKIIV